ncbi:hypothetical protein DICPUDRAFT_83253 [Dictyostelium purpureum]|uniref:Uncharacterized protein n=1 Tax=Dictyostelium purpureum TaxID=5786 RepID=F0ZZ04_DICPU|nr:uncharacterized protein DICPUDRAFT_83253 [Dictyostelium purpureum]EGC30835.1 hypothetical protein DICPUDRAFT_83253 [Dictyostelium purpureum]|eukprot:XP_003292649.1 hypothetical protein DICPUDRAFT_83253 [Dictyostelium purpureum]
MEGCPHQRFSYEELFKISRKNYLNVIEQLVQSSDNKNININSRCTPACKEKMIRIVQATFNQYRDDLCWYYNDAKLVDGGSATDYICAMTGMWEKDPFLYNFTPQLNEHGQVPEYPNVVNKDIKE